jgi:hypothetical protein
VPTRPGGGTPRPERAPAGAGGAPEIGGPSASSGPGGATSRGPTFYGDPTSREPTPFGALRPGWVLPVAVVGAAGLASLVTWLLAR